MTTTLVSIGTLDNGHIRVGLRSNAIKALQLVRAIHQRGAFAEKITVRGTLGIHKDDEYFDFTSGNDVATMMYELNVTIG
jgi:hypothetical protein